MPSDLSPRSGKTVIFQIIRRLRFQPLKASGYRESVWNPAIQRHVQQLPSPVSPSIVETPPLSPLQPPLVGLVPTCLSGKPSVAPLQDFLQELIRRSRTSWTVLQTALCYIEAARRKLPEIANAPVAPVKESTLGESSQDSEPTPPEPLVPSPLLCLRRTFLASLIPASKFLQDRCYSNRAWVKLSRSHADLSLGTTNLCRASSRTIGRSRTLPSIGTECSNAQTFPVAPTSPKLDPYQNWLILNQSRLEAEEEEEEEPIPMAVECMSVPPMSDALVPATPPLVQSPASSISSTASITSFDSDDGDRTIQVADISEPPRQKFPGNLDTWFDPAALTPDIAICGVCNTKAFEYVELANSYHLE